MLANDIVENEIAEEPAAGLRFPHLLATRLYSLPRELFDRGDIRRAEDDVGLDELGRRRKGQLLGVRDRQVFDRLERLRDRYDDRRRQYPSHPVAQKNHPTEPSTESDF